MTRKKSVAESVDHLLKPRSLAQSDSEEEELKFSESLANLSGKQRPRPSGILKKNNPQLHELDRKYKGVAVSRKDYEDSEDEDAESDEDDEEVESEDSDEDDDEVESEDSDEDDDENEDDNDMGISEFVNQFKAKIQKDTGSDQENLELESSEDDGEDDLSGEDSSEDAEEEDDDDDEDSDDNEQESMAENDDDDVDESEMKILQPVHENSVQKGQAVRTQLDLWERILETRIKIQPVLNKANSLPTHSLFSKFSETTDEFKAVAEETQKNVSCLLDNLINLQNSMMAQFGETRAILKSGLYKRKLSDDKVDGTAKRTRLEFQDNGKSTAIFQTYRNSVLQKWSDRTKVTNARSSKELLMNHNIVNQIEGVLLNKPDLVKTSQTVKGTYELFGKSKETSQDDNEGTQKWCPEIYDDTDFYHQMLRELIEYKSNGSSNPAEAAKNYSELQKLRTKIKKQVDQKASKGRKIRYVVHKKIVSFMAPYSNSHWTDEAVGELFSSLFGNYEKSMGRKDRLDDDANDEDNSQQEVTSDIKIL